MTYSKMVFFRELTHVGYVFTINEISALHILNQLLYRLINELLFTLKKEKICFLFCLVRIFYLCFSVYLLAIMNLYNHVDV